MSAAGVQVDHDAEHVVQRHTRYRGDLAFLCIKLVEDGIALRTLAGAEGVRYTGIREDLEVTDRHWSIREGATWPHLGPNMQQYIRQLQKPNSSKSSHILGSMSLDYRRCALRNSVGSCTHISRQVAGRPNKASYRKLSA
jgi:hypothetical protein